MKNNPDYDNLLTGYDVFSGSGEDGPNSTGEELDFYQSIIDPARLNNYSSNYPSGVGLSYQIPFTNPVSGGHLSHPNIDN